MAATAKSLQSCLTLCDTIDGSPPGSPIPGILQARTLEWVDMTYQKMHNYGDSKKFRGFKGFREGRNKQVEHRGCLGGLNSSVCYSNGGSFFVETQRRRNASLMHRHTDNEVKISEVAQSWPTLCDPMDCSRPGSSIHGIFLGESTGVGCHCLRQPCTKNLNLYFAPYTIINLK